MSNHLSQTTEVHEFYGDNTVRTAAQLIDKLPNGWELVSLTHRTEYKIGSWIAVVRGPRGDVKPSARP